MSLHKKIMAAAGIVTIACDGGNGVTGTRITPENLVEVTTEQGAEALRELATLVAERTTPVVTALAEVPECPERQEAPFEMRLGRPVDPTDAQAWRNYTGLIGSCQGSKTRLNFIARQVDSIRTVYETEYIETTLARIRERVTPERLERNAVDIETLTDAELSARWAQLHYVAYQRAYGFRIAGMLDPGTWPDVDHERVEATLNNLEEGVENETFDVRDAIDDATDLYKRMERGDHR